MVIIILHPKFQKHLHPALLAKTISMQCFKKARCITVFNCREGKATMIIGRSAGLA
jgi:hypothetical protein